MQKVLILDFGGQYHQLLARKVRACKIYCEVHPARKATAQWVQSFAPAAILLTGGTQSVLEADAPRLSPEILDLGIPILGIGCGCRILAKQLGAELIPARKQPGYSRSLAVLDPREPLFLDRIPETVTWMADSDEITALPAGFIPIAHTFHSPVVGFCCPARKLYGLQFHPEDSHTDNGIAMLRNFLCDLCGITPGWSMEDEADRMITSLRRQIGSGRVLLALSGGVDSSVLATLLSRAVGSQLTCIFVDNGLLREAEGDQVQAVFSRMDMHFIRVDARERFYTRLAGVIDPEEKRRVIGEEFAAVFEAEAKKLGHVDYFAQGTIYSDVIESGGELANWQRSVAGWPVELDVGQTLEPLHRLFKEEVRSLGHVMGLPQPLLDRQPFPEPGLAIRIMGEVTREKVVLLQKADAIFRTELEKAHMSSLLGQYFAVLLEGQSAAVAAGERTFGNVLALRAVTTEDYLTAKWARIPYELLDRISHRILSEVPDITRIVYDITTKPPAAIEWL